MLLRIVAPHFVAGVVLSSTFRAQRVAPILSYMLGWSEDDIRNYCKKKDWLCHEF